LKSARAFNLAGAKASNGAGVDGPPAPILYINPERSEGSIMGKIIRVDLIFVESLTGYSKNETLPRQRRAQHFVQGL
jgi:hypothetical protein